MESVRTLGKKLTGFMELVKFEHTIFALPFALMALVMSSNGIPELTKTFWILVCMVSARSASMAFNRIVDYRYDLKNKRTHQRPLQTKRVSLREAWILTVATALVYLLGAAMLNRLAVILSFPVLAVLLGYSYTKRFTYLSHFVLGFSLGCAPVAVWVAVTATIPFVSLLLCAAVTFWVGGFDIVYSIQDYEFDRRERLRSFPARFGISEAFTAARYCHMVSMAFFILTGIYGGMGFFYYIGLLLIGSVLTYEHHILEKHGLSRIDMAFFTLNGIVSIFFFIFSVADIFVRRS